VIVCPKCASAINFVNAALTCSLCKGTCCEQCATPYDGQILCSDCAVKYRQINLLPEPPEEEDDF